MKRWEPIAYPGPDNGFGAATHKNFNQGTGARGSWLDAGGYQQIIDELCLVAEAAGLTLSEADSTQLLRAIRSQAMNYVEVAGSANVLTADLTPNLAAYVKGLPLRLKIATTNTDVMTLNVDGVGAISLLRRDGSAMKPGDAVGGQILTFIFGPGNAFYCSSLVASDLVTAAPSAGRTQVFTASGSFVVPSTQLEVWAVGGGGSGGASGDGSGGGVAGNMGGGGGAGAFGYKRVTGLTAGATVAVAIGAGGSAGGAGGSTSFGAHLTCAGGGAGTGGVSTVGSGGSGGVATGADVSVPGGAGGFSGPNSPSSVTPSDVIRIYGRGGMVAGGWGTVTWGGTGGAGQGYGSGGNGASGGSLLAGGAGAPGLLIVRW